VKLYRYYYIGNFLLELFVSATLAGQKHSAQENLQPFKEKALDCEIKWGSAFL